MKHLEQRVKKGFSVVELVLAIGLFSLAFGYIGFFAIDSLRFNENFVLKVQVNQKVQEMSNAINIIKSDNWGEILNNSDGTDKYLVFQDGMYSIQDGRDTSGDITTWFVLESVERNMGGDIVESGGTTDIRSKRITFTASWLDSLGKVNTTSRVQYITDWNAATWNEDLIADFNDGTFDLTYATDSSGGEVQLETITYGDWCKPSLALTSFDLPGQGVAGSIQATPGNAYMGTGSNASGLSFIHTTISDTDTINVTVEGTYDGYKTNAVFGDDTYAYLATDTNDKEIVILDITTTPFTEVGYFDAPGNRNAESIYVKDNIGYMTQDDDLRVFDLSSKTGSRPQINSHRLFDKGTFMQVQGEYAYILIAGAVEELEIVDISDVNNMQTTGYTNVNSGVAVTALHVDDSSEYMYIGANSSSSFDEVFTIDISSKIGDRPIVGSYDTGAMSVRALEVVENNTRVIALGQDGEEYQVLDTSVPTNPVYCGGTDLPGGGNGIAAVVFSESANAYSYIVTGDSASELKIVKGGAGGGNELGIGYSDTGKYVSSVFDTGSSNSDFYYFGWNATIPSATNLQLQFRAGNTSDLSGESWVGLDGTSNTYFTEPSTRTLPAILDGKRYIQYRLLFSSDTIETPIAEQIQVFYQIITP